MTNNEAQEKKTHSTASLFGSVTTEGADHKAYEALASRRRTMGRILWGAVALGVAVLVWLVVGGAWRNAKSKAEAELEALRAEYKAEQDLKNNDESYSYVGSPDALLKLEWHFRPKEACSSRMRKVMMDAVGQKPSEVCIVDIAKPLVQGLPQEEYKVTFSINGSYTAEHVREDGTMETVELNNEMDAQLLAEIIMQYHARFYGDVQWPLELSAPAEEESHAAEEQHDHAAEEQNEEDDAAPVTDESDDGVPVQIPSEMPSRPESIKLPELDLSGSSK